MTDAFSDRITKAAMSGAEDAARNYMVWTGGTSRPWDPPTYVMTVGALQGISKISKSSGGLRLFCETSASEAIYQSAGKLRGYPNTLQLYGRADIVVCRGRVAKGVIEVKKGIWGPSQLQKDAERLVASLREDNATLEFGLSLFVTGCLVAKCGGKPRTLELARQLARSRSELNRKQAEIGVRPGHHDGRLSRTDSELGRKGPG